MGDNFIDPKVIIKLAIQFGWAAHRSVSGGDHTTMFKRPGGRTVPMRHKIRGRMEAQILLKELGIPRAAWPDKAR